MRLVIELVKYWTHLNFGQQTSSLLALITCLLISTNHSKNIKFVDWSVFLASTTYFVAYTLGIQDKKSRNGCEISKLIVERDGFKRQLSSKEETIKTLLDKIAEYDSEVNKLSQALKDNKYHAENIIRDLISQHRVEMSKSKKQIEDTKLWANEYVKLIDSNYQIDKESLIQKQTELLNSEMGERSERFRKYRAKILSKYQESLEKYKELSDERDSLLRLLEDVKASQKETLELLEEHIRSAEMWKNAATNEFEKVVNDYDAELKEYQLRLKSMPVSEMFNGSDKASMNGNRLIGLLQKHGLIVHAARCESLKEKDIIWVRPANCVASQIEDKAEIIQICFELIKKPVIDIDSGLIRIELPISSDVFDVYRICKHYTDLEILVSKWERIKIDGGSESGKSPLADNLIALKRLQQSIKVFLSNPLYGSKKDYWKIDATYKSYSEARKGLSDFKTLLNNRAKLAKQSKELNGNYPIDEFKMFIFDEIDTTLEGDKTSKDNLKEILKTASHYDLGIIFIGQSPYCSDAGLKQADFNNCVQIHIGSVALKAIELSSYSSDMKAKLQNDYHKINRFFADKNRSIKSEADRHRFALVDDGKSEPYFIELPPIGFYAGVVNQDSEQHTEQHLESRKVETVDTRGILNVAESVVLPLCKHCGSSNTKKNGVKGNRQRYQCKECSKTFSEVIKTSILN